MKIYSKKIGILGAGSYATAIAKLFSQNTDYKIVLWARNSQVCHGINQHKKNPRYLKHIELGESVSCSLSINNVVSDSEYLFCLLPMLCIREVLTLIKNKISKDTIVISGVKGIEQDTLMTVSEIVQELLPESIYSNLLVLSGPSFALELAEAKIANVSLGYSSRKAKEDLCALMNFRRFKLFPTRDVIGTEIAGALKNVIAIATGIVDGLNLGVNARAAIITGGLAEMSQIGLRKGARLDTFLGLAGVGDLVLTCTGDLSRNRFVGQQLGRGKMLEDIIASMDMVAEGVRTTKSAYQLTCDLNLYAPIIEQLYQILYQNKPLSEVESIFL